VIDMIACFFMAA